MCMEVLFSHDLIKINIVDVSVWCTSTSRGCRFISASVPLPCRWPQTCKWYERDTFHRLFRWGGVIHLGTTNDFTKCYSNLSTVCYWYFSLDQSDGPTEWQADRLVENTTRCLFSVVYTAHSPYCEISFTPCSIYRRTTPLRRMDVCFPEFPQQECILNFRQISATLQECVFQPLLWRCSALWRIPPC